jgi:hypothetical protein
LKLGKLGDVKMDSSKVRLIGLIILILGISMALIGAFIYQPALWGMLMNTPDEVHLHDAQLFAVIAQGGLIMTIIGAVLVFSNRKN